MNKEELLNEVCKMLDHFEGASPYDTSEVEAARDALATAIGNFINAGKHEGDRETFNSLHEALEAMNLSRIGKEKLSEVLKDLDEVLEASNYDSDEEDQGDRLSELKSNFYEILKPELDQLRIKNV